MKRDERDLKKSIDLLFTQITNMKKYIKSMNMDEWLPELREHKERINALSDTFAQYNDRVFREDLTLKMDGITPAHLERIWKRADREDSKPGDE